MYVTANNNNNNNNKEGTGGGGGGGGEEEEEEEELSRGMFSLRFCDTKQEFRKKILYVDNIKVIQVFLQNHVLVVKNV